MKFIITLVLSVVSAATYGQTERIELQGNYSQDDSLHIVRSYLQAKKAVDEMSAAMHSLWNVSGRHKMKMRAERWRNDKTFMRWLGEPDHMRLVARSIRKIHRKFDRKFILEVVKVDEGRCNRWVGAWAVPYGRVKIRLCLNFLNIRGDMSSKFLIHEVGHEAGMFFHKDLFSCRDVLAAAQAQSDEAKRSPETYAWLAMSYVGLDCSYRWQ